MVSTMNKSSDTKVTPANASDVQMGSLPGKLLIPKGWKNNKNPPTKAVKTNTTLR